MLTGSSNSVELENRTEEIVNLRSYSISCELRTINTWKNAETKAKSFTAYKNNHHGR